MLTSKQRAYLRGLANKLPCIFQVGRGGVTDEIAKQIGNALEARELIKAKTLDNCDYSAAEAANAIAKAIGADVVTVVGNKFVLYRESEKHKKIDINV